MVSNGTIDLNTEGNLHWKGCVYFLKSKFNKHCQSGPKIIETTLIWVAKIFPFQTVAFLKWNKLDFGLMFAMSYYFYFLWWLRPGVLTKFFLKMGFLNLSLIFVWSLKIIKDADSISKVLYYKKCALKQSDHAPYKWKQ